MGLLLVSLAFLYSCTNKTADPVLKISENSVNILQAESKTITLETNLELGVRVTDTSICKASINGNQVIITGKVAEQLMFAFMIKKMKKILKIF